MVPEVLAFSKKIWDTLSADEKRLFSRMAEVYAGFSEYTDAQVGRVAHQARHSRVGVLHRVDGVVVRSPGPEVEVDVDLAVAVVARQGVARRIDADRADQVVDRGQ